MVMLWWVILVCLVRVVVVVCAVAVGLGEGVLVMFVEFSGWRFLWMFFSLCWWFVGMVYTVLFVGEF